MTQLIFASNNQHKVNEIKSLIVNEFEIVTLENAGIQIDIPEPHDTMEANAEEKARIIYNLTQKSCFSEDSGLEIEALNGRPGVKSARYAGESKSSKDNISRVLDELKDVKNRHANFKTVISLMYNGVHHSFLGICKGTIIASTKGNHGFGYDPIFIPAGSDKTFAEMELKEKNVYSHRRKAIEKLIKFLKEEV